MGGGDEADFLRFSSFFYKNLNFPRSNNSVINIEKKVSSGGVDCAVGHCFGWVIILDCKSIQTRCIN